MVKLSNTGLPPQGKVKHEGQADLMHVLRIAGCTGFGTGQTVQGSRHQMCREGQPGSHTQLILEMQATADR